LAVQLVVCKSVVKLVLAASRLAMFQVAVRINHSIEVALHKRSEISVDAVHLNVSRASALHERLAMFQVAVRINHSIEVALHKRFEISVNAVHLNVSRASALNRRLAMFQVAARINHSIEVALHRRLIIFHDNGSISAVLNMFKSLPVKNPTISQVLNSHFILIHLSNPFVQ
jgi:ribosomal protein S21